MISESPRVISAASGIGAKTQAIGNTDRYREHVLERAAQFHTDDIRGGIGTKMMPAQTLGECRGRRFVIAGTGDSGR